MFTTKRNILTAAFGLALCGLARRLHAQFNRSPRRRNHLWHFPRRTTSVGVETQFAAIGRIGYYHGVLLQSSNYGDCHSDIVAAAFLLKPVVAGLIKSASTPAATASKLTALVKSWPEAPADLKAAADARRFWGR